MIIKSLLENTIHEKAYAKLNISLDVSKPRADGYHDMLMVMQTVSICDDVSIRLNNTGRFHAGTGLPFIPGDERNLAVKAAKLFLQETGHQDMGAEIRIKKAIPVGAGMAGGSADAAAVLRAMNRSFNYPLDNAALLKLSEKAGSDVPFCVIGGTALAQGRGELLTELRPLPDCRFVICKPDFSISTPELFRAIDGIRLRTHPDTKGIVEAIDAGDLKQICRRMYNVFEDVQDRRMKTVSEIKRKMLAGGAEASIMTGTGSATYGVFSPEADTEQLCRELKKEYGFCVYAKPVGKLI